MHKPSSEEQAQIQERQESLQTKIETFHQQALRYFQSDTASIIQSSSNNALEVVGINLEDSDEEVFFLDAESEWEEDTEIYAEKARLWLPSSFTKSEWVQMGLGQVSEVEAELHEGQANNTLEALQAGLAEKSPRFRTEVKPAKGQKTMTRAWDSIHRADKQIQGAVCVTISPFWPCFWPSSFPFSHQVHALLKSLCKKTTKTSYNTRYPLGTKYYKERGISTQSSPASGSAQNSGTP